MLGGGTVKELYELKGKDPHQTVCRPGCCAGTLKRSLKRGRKSASTRLASGMVDAPARRSSLISLSWKVPAIRSTRPLPCGDRANTNCMPSSSIARVNCVAALTFCLVPGVCLKTECLSA